MADEVPNPLLNRACIHEDDVRHYVLDLSAQDNGIGMDLAYSSEEIARAMVAAARSYNSIPPLIHMVSADALPGDTNVFLDGTVYHLALAKLQLLMRQDIDYTAGGVTTNLVSKQIEHMKYLIDKTGKDFTTVAKSLKIARNIAMAYGEVG